MRQRYNFPTVVCYSLKFTLCSLLVIKSIVTRCKICSLLIAKVARWKKSLVTRCRSCMLQKITCYSLQYSFVTRCRSCWLQKITRYTLQSLLVICCRSCSLQKITRYSLQKLLAAKDHSLLVAKFARRSLQKMESLFETFLKSDPNTGFFSEFLRNFQNTYFADICERLLLNNIKT